MEKIRTFIAIKLSPKIISKISGAQEGLKRSGAWVKWVRPENIHLTLKFLGYIIPEELERVKIAARDTLKLFKPFEISVFGLGAFPKIEYPRLIWVGIDEGKEELKRMVSNLEKRLAIIGFTREKRPFSPHLTIGRVKSSKRRERLIEAFTKFTAPNLGNMRATKISIVKSELTPQGPIYTTMDEIPLKK